MDDRDEVIRLINQVTNRWPEAVCFSGPADDSRIRQIEEMLGVSLPESYKWFVREYGNGGIGGVEILGVGKPTVPYCVRTTERYRRYGLPRSFVVIENVDEWQYCLETEQMQDGECPVTDWDMRGAVGLHKRDNFYKFVIEEFARAIENLESENTD